MSESRFAIAEFEAELASEQMLQTLAYQHEVHSRRRESDPEIDSETEIDIDPWRPLFDGE